jgi:predicted flavoprotein YhiN
VQLVKLLGKQGWVVFTAGPSFAPRIYEATALINSFGISVCPHILSDRAAYRHASAAGKTVLEFEPHDAPLGNRTVAHVDMCTCAHHTCASVGSARMSRFANLADKPVVRATETPNQLEQAEHTPAELRRAGLGAR